MTPSEILNQSVAMTHETEHRLSDRPSADDPRSGGQHPEGQGRASPRRRRRGFRNEIETEAELGLA